VPDGKVLECIECGTVAVATAVGWRAYRIDNPDEGDPPELAFYCPVCAEREFGADAEE
jgi:hypothetical protein